MVKNRPFLGILASSRGLVMVWLDLIKHSFGVFWLKTIAPMELMGKPDQTGCAFRSILAMLSKFFVWFGHNQHLNMCRGVFFRKNVPALRGSKLNYCHVRRGHFWEENSTTHFFVFVVFTLNLDYIKSGKVGWSFTGLRLAI